MSNVPNDSAAILEHITAAVCQYRGHTFTTQKEFQHNLDKTRIEILALIRQSNVDLIEGLELLRDNGGSHVRDYVSGIATELLAHLNSPDALAGVAEKIWQNEHSLLFFNDVIDSFYECGDFRKEHCLIAVYMALFPFNPQPYACLGVLIWRREGIAAAENYYTNIIDALQNPVLDYHAAECFYKNGNKSKTREILQRALVNAEKSPDAHIDTKLRLRKFWEKVDGLPG